MDAQTLREVMGSTLPNGGYTKLIDAYNNAARAAGINNVKRAAMWAFVPRPHARPRPKVEITAGHMVQLGI